MTLKKWMICLFVICCSGYASSEKIHLVAIDYPPFIGKELMGNGPFAELVSRSFRNTGYGIQVEYLPWARSMSEAKAGRVDGVIGGWYSVERAEDFLYSDPIHPNEMVFYKRKGEDITFTSYASLVKQGFTLGSVRGYALPKGLEESGISINLVTEDIQNLKMLAKQRIDLVVVDKEFARYVLRDFPQVAKEIEWMEPVLERPQQYLIISKKAKNAQKKLDEFNKGLKLLRQTGEFNRIMRKHGFEL